MSTPQFSPDDITLIKSRVSILDVIGNDVALSRRGSNWVGLCPFHEEKTPSFTISPTKELYHCFGCGAGGDLVNYVQRHDALTYPQAIAALASRAGIQPALAAEHTPPAKSPDQPYRPADTALQSAHDQNERNLAMSAITVSGNLTGIPQLEQDKNGKPWCHAQIAATDRIRQADGTFVDGQTVFYDFPLFGQDAANLVTTAEQSGNIRLTVSGNLTNRTFPRKDGTVGVAHDISDADVSISLRGQIANVARSDGQRVGVSKAASTAAAVGAVAQQGMDPVAAGQPSTRPQPQAASPQAAQQVQQGVGV